LSFHRVDAPVPHAPWLHSSPGGHVAQVPASTPHALAAHVPPAQHAAPHATSHWLTVMQAPALHCFPEAHAVHAPPPSPHSSGARPAWHTPPSSQQPEHVAAHPIGGSSMHAPALQSWLAAHELHRAPAAPQAERVSPERQRPCMSQQPAQPESAHGGGGSGREVQATQSKARAMVLTRFLSSRLLARPATDRKVWYRSARHPAWSSSASASTW
jgi:hypothetical protein